MGEEEEVERRKERVRVMDELTGQGKRRREGCVHVAFLHGPSTESMINLCQSPRSS